MIEYIDVVKQLAKLQEEMEGGHFHIKDYVFLVHPDSWLPLHRLAKKIRRFQKRRWIQGRWCSHHYSGNKVRSRKK